MIEFHAYDLSTMLPELFLLGATCAILLIDLFLKPSQRDTTHWLSILALVVTGLLVWRNKVPDGVSLSAFNDMFVLDGMATILKLFILLVTIAVCLYGRAYLRDRKLHIGEFYLLILFATLGMMLLVSAGNMITVYLGLEIMPLRPYAPLALNRTPARSNEPAINYLVLGALASRLL